MSTLDLTADAHLQVLSTVPHIRKLRSPRAVAIDRFTARYSWNVMQLRVLATETTPDVWTISTFPGLRHTPVDDLNDATRVFHGGNTYAVNGSLVTALTDAGYTVTGSDYGSTYEEVYI